MFALSPAKALPLVAGVGRKNNVDEIAHPTLRVPVTISTRQGVTARPRIATDPNAATVLFAVIGTTASDKHGLWRADDPTPPESRELRIKNRELSGAGVIKTA